MRSNGFSLVELAVVLLLIALLAAALVPLCRVGNAVGDGANAAAGATESR